MEIGVLGPLEVSADGRPVPVGGVKPRGLVAVLALHANESVGAERLAVALWGEDAPAAAVKTVQVYVSRLRRAFGDADLLTTTATGYRLRLRPGALDAERFDRRVADGRRAMAAGDARQAAAVLREALELWRGAPLEDVASLPFAPTEIARLEEQRLAAVELRVEADLAAGAHAELVAELGALTREHPWRERLHAQHMLALYRSGRQADALEAYRRAREVLVEELGIEPGAELADLHQAILAQDPGLDADHDSVAAAAGDRGLPAPPNRTIGRQTELAAITARLRERSTRLLTLTGPGGVGKTRLALEAARAAGPGFADGAHLVSLAPLRRAEDVPAAIAAALGVVAVSGELPEQAIERFLSVKDVLLVVDNCEHVLGAVPFIGAMLESCPGLTVLATSREALALRAEERRPVPPLALPATRAEDPEALAGVDAVALFAERARAHDPDFELHRANAAAVATICRRLDGLPLALELAAARCELLSAEEIAERLEVALGALGAGPRDAPARQQTLWATIDWSFALLDEDEKACFTRFAVFAGGATVEAAETITGAGLETLERLVAKSLLVRRRRPGGEPTRLGMLETLRAYALERLDAAPDDAVRDRHHRHFLALAERHGSERALWGVGRAEHLARLDPEIDNLHSALGWAVDRGDAGRAHALSAALGWYWLMRDRYAEAVEWIDRTLGMAGAAEHPVQQVGALRTKSWALWPLGRVGEQAAVMARAEAIARDLGDPLLLSQVLETRAVHETGGGRRDVGEALADEALALASAEGDRWAMAMAAAARARAAGDAAQLRERIDVAVSLLDDVGNVYELADLLATAAYAALAHGSEQDAIEFAGRAAPVTRSLDNPYMWMLLRGNFALAALLAGDTDAAADAFREELTLCRTLVFVPFLHEGLSGLAAVAAAHDDLARAARLCGAAEAHRYEERDDPVRLRLHTTFFAPARDRYGAEAWDAEAGEGAALGFDDAIAYALGDGSPAPSLTRPTAPAASRRT